MTYQTIKNLRQENQQGVTLLLAILVLSSIMAISFSLATILFIEVRSSSDLLKSESSLYGATAIGEEAVFSIKRGVCPTSNLNCFTFPSQFNNSTVLQTQPVFSSTSTPVIQDKIPKATSFTSTTKKYDFCGANVYSSGCGYGKVTITFNDIGNGASVYAYLCEFDASGNTSYTSSPCTEQYYSGSPSYWSHTAQLSASSNSTVSWDLDTNSQQMLILFNPSSTADAYVSITTYANDKTTLKGLPYLGQTAVDINTSNGNLGRKVRVVVPNGQ
ncbi:MAG: hypothetical protein HY918_00045 [Candidatus Doudnabacteria bacterium]|nr:hypothetical protein [Candidatus Doudnabacteria bacterium]